MLCAGKLFGKLPKGQASACAPQKGNAPKILLRAIVDLA
jgi:hypothetical protein